MNFRDELPVLHQRSSSGKRYSRIRIANIPGYPFPVLINIRFRVGGLAVIRRVRGVLRMAFSASFVTGTKQSYTPSKEVGLDAQLRWA